MEEQIFILEQKVASLEKEIAELKVQVPGRLTVEMLAQELARFNSVRVSGLSKSKLDWLKEIGAKEFEHPAKYCVHNWVFSEEYLNNTPLEELKRRYLSVNSERPGYEIEG